MIPTGDRSCDPELVRQARVRVGQESGPMPTTVDVARSTQVVEFADRRAAGRALTSALRRFSHDNACGRSTDAIDSPPALEPFRPCFDT